MDWKIDSTTKLTKTVKLYTIWSILGPGRQSEKFAFATQLDEKPPSRQAAAKMNICRLYAEDAKAALEAFNLHDKSRSEFEIYRTPFGSITVWDEARSGIAFNLPSEFPIEWIRAVVDVYDNAITYGPDLGEGLDEDEDEGGDP